MDKLKSAEIIVEQKGCCTTPFDLDCRECFVSQEDRLPSGKCGKFNDIELCQKAKDFIKKKPIKSKMETLATTWDCIREDHDCLVCGFSSINNGDNLPCIAYAVKFLEDKQKDILKNSYPGSVNVYNPEATTPNKDDWYYPTKDNLCVTDILIGGYEFEYYNDFVKKWGVSQVSLLTIIRNIKDSGFEYRFKLKKTDEQKQDDLIDEVLKKYSGSMTLSKGSVKDLMKICLNKGKENE